VAPKTETRTLSGLDRAALLRLYRNMLLSRRVDEKEIQLKRQNRIYFQINGVGHEAVGAAVGEAFRAGSDWFFFYYRDRAASLALGITAKDMFLQAVGSADDPQSGARQMPSHFSSPLLHVANTSSPTGTQFLQAVGCAEAGLHGRRRSIPGVEAAEDEVVLVTSGDGTTSEGEFWEAMNTASNLRLPVVFLIEDNGYAISVPVEVNTAGGSISRLVSSFPDLLVREVDGCDPLASVEALRAAVAHCRARKGPALVHAHVIRPFSHSLSDDETQYRTPEERESDAARDPLRTFPRRLVEEGIADEAELRALEAEVDEEVRRAADEAVVGRVAPEPRSALLHVYSPELDPTDRSLEAAPLGEGQPATMVDLLNRCLKDEMARDPRIVVFGEDVADASRAGVLDRVKGKGGVFKVTWGLQRTFGGDRVFNSPLAEANIVGRAIGMAMRGLKPVVEIQFFDYIWPAYMQIRDELATLRWRSNGTFKAPVVIRVAYGGYISGGAIYHSQTGAALFTANPGLRVVCPSSALDANGLLRTAIRCDDPVLFLEHKHLYRQTHNKGAYPGPDFTIPFARAATVRPGTDVTVVTYGATVYRALQAARQLEDSGVSAEILDLRTLSPVDWDAIAASARRTGKVLVLTEDSLSWGYGAELAARVGEELYTELDGPVRRLAAADTFVPYAPELEDFVLPQVSDIVRAVSELAAW
jgi:2-oxoisovalerate dehydrogenase E1 component